MASRRSGGMRVPSFFRRLFKFTSMDFETAVWEMIHLIIAPKKVFRNIYYNKQTRNSYHRPDPAFTYLLSLFYSLTGLAWGLAYANGLTSTIQVPLVFVFGHFLGISVLVSALVYLFIGRLLGKRRPGLFGLPPVNADGEGLEFGYCFDVSIRACLPIWVFLYVLQFLFMPLIAPDYWVSNFFGNTMYLLALSYYFIITFLGYNALPSLSGTEILLVPIPVLAVLWMLSLYFLDASTYFAPILWCGAHLRKEV